MPTRIPTSGFTYVPVWPCDDLTTTTLRPPYLRIDLGAVGQAQAVRAVDRRLPCAVVESHGEDAVIRRGSRDVRATPRNHTRLMLDKDSVMEAIAHSTVVIERRDVVQRARNADDTPQTERKERQRNRRETDVEPRPGLDRAHI